MIFQFIARLGLLSIHHELQFISITVFAYILTVFVFSGYKQQSKVFMSTMFCSHPTILITGEGSGMFTIIIAQESINLFQNVVVPSEHEKACRNLHHFLFPLWLLFLQLKTH